MSETRGSIVLVAVGRADRADDGVGPALAEALRARRLEGVRIELHAADAAEMLEAWRGAAGAIVLDCVRSGAAPGTVHRVEPFAGATPGVSLGASSHALGVAAAVELARALGELPPRLALVGIEGRDFTVGGAMTKEVQCAIPPAAEAAAGVIARWRREAEEVPRA